MQDSMVLPPPSPTRHPPLRPSLFNFVNGCTQDCALIKPGGCTISVHLDISQKKERKKKERMKSKPTFKAKINVIIDKDLKARRSHAKRVFMMF